MKVSLDWFERVVRSVGDAVDPPVVPLDPVDVEQPHPFETRNIHPDLPKKVRKLFDDGHYDDSVFAAFKYVAKEVMRISRIRGQTGFKLMMDAFNEANAKIPLNALSTDSEIDEQRGYRHMFAGSVSGIRNPRGHEVDMADTLDDALDYLSVASLLLRKLDRRPV